MILNASRLVALSLAAVSLFAVPAAHAQAGKPNCRASKFVLESAASLKANTEKGGHVSIHVKGQKTEATKSQFKDEASFQAAWTVWAEYSGAKGPTPSTCGGKDGGATDCVPASLLGIDSSKEGYTCDAVDGQGKCTAGRNFTPLKVAFRFAKNSKGVWILNTAYPTLNATCQ